MTGAGRTAATGGGQLQRMSRVAKLSHDELVNKGDVVVAENSHQDAARPDRGTDYISLSSLRDIK